MNRKNIVLLSFLAFFLSSCFFDSEESGLTDWLSDQGMPSSYKVQVVTVENITPLSAEVFLDSTPRSGRGMGIFGATANLSHDLVLDFGLDSAFIRKLSKADSTKSMLHLTLYTGFYGNKGFPKDSLPIEETLNLKVSWKLSNTMKKGDLENLSDIVDTTWFHELENWEPEGSADTTYDISVDTKDTIKVIDLPGALVKSICEKVGNRRLQLRVSAPEASHIFRFYGISDGFYPQSPVFRAAVNDSIYENAYVPMHAANILSNKESCSDCLVLHAGVNDSLVLEYPSAPIMKALADFYGDDFPYVINDSNDVRQAVVMAQITYERDDSQGSSELGLPIQVASCTFLDSADTVIRAVEYYKLRDYKDIAENGHQNLIFHRGDALSLPVTNGMRDFINKAGDGRTFKMMMHLHYPVLMDNDSLYANHLNDKGDTVQVVFPMYDYARYDMTQSVMEKPATLKLWLASKRGNE